MALGEAGQITVSVICSPRAGESLCVDLMLPVGSTVQQAIDASGALAQFTPAAIGIWGKPCKPTDCLRDQDRVELYRPLLIDPMEARRARQRQQKASR